MMWQGRLIFLISLPPNYITDPNYIANRLL